MHAKKNLIIIASLFFLLSTITFSVFARDTSTEDGYGDKPIRQQQSSEETLKQLICLFFCNDSISTDLEKPNNSNNQQTPNQNNNVPTQTPNGLEVNQSFLALDELWEYVGNKVGVPPCLLDAVSYIEYATVNNYSPSQIQQYQQPGQVIPNCPWNYCSAAGHMQMTMGIDERGDTKCTRCGHGYCPNAWASSNQGQAVLRYEGGGYNPNVCNLRDSTFAAAQKLKNDSGTAPSDMNWSTDKMIYVGGRYYGSSTQRHERLQNRTYGEFIADNCRL